MPEFSAHGSILKPQLVGAENPHRREMEPAQTGRIGVRSGRPRFRVVEQGSALVGRENDQPTPVSPSVSTKAVLKRAFDILGATVLGLVFAPLILVVMVLLRWEGGSVIYRHRRISRDGKAFDCLKFRSMVPDADRVLHALLEQRPELKVEWLRDHKLRDDPRITGVGRFLRRTSLDELPQLWNVMRGEMSLVGPRPVVREELLRYGRCADIYLSTRPGVTGLWQVTGRNNTDYRRRVVLDVYYVRRQNLILDCYILLKTIQVVLGGKGAY